MFTLSPFQSGQFADGFLIVGLVKDPNSSKDLYIYIIIYVYIYTQDLYIYIIIYVYIYIHTHISPDFLCPLCLHLHPA